MVIVLTEVQFVKKRRKPRARAGRLPSKPQEPRTLPERPPQRRRYRGFLEHANSYLTIAVSLIALVGGAYAYFPSIDILANPVMNKMNAFDAEFTVTNNGRVPVYDIIIACEINSRGGHDVITEGNSSQSPIGTVGDQGIDYLPPHSSITRNCGGGFSGDFNSNLAYPASIKVTSKYTWPIVPVRSLETRTFSSRRDIAGNILLIPDSGW